MPWAGLRASSRNKSVAVSADIIGLRNALRPAIDYTVDVELAQSSSSGIAAPGFAARAYGRWPWMVYDVQVMRAQLRRLSHRDMQFFSAGSTVMPLADCRLEGNVRFDEGNINENAALPYAPAQRFYLACIGYHFFTTL